MEEIDSELIKEAYAQFGLCIYQIQCIEKSFAISIIQNSFDNRSISSAQYDYELSKLFENTLGQLLTKCTKDNIKLPNEIAKEYDSILEKRNYIVHDYWWYNSDSLTSNDGFTILISELKSLNAYFENLDELVSIENEKYLLQKGIDSQKLEAILIEILEGKRKGRNKQRVLKKKENIINCYIYMIDIDKGNALLVVELDDNLLCTIGDNGLIPIEIDKSRLTLIRKMEKYLPAESNLGPSVSRYWNYYIDLKTRVRIKVYTKDMVKGVIWKIEYPK